jgi:SpoIID/LytB domain protein
LGLLSLCALVPAAAAPATRAAGQTIDYVVVSGRGVGHGMGLSQWGAAERARAGATYREILAFYYPNSELGIAPSRTIRVLIGEGPRLLVGSEAAFTVRDGAGRSARMPAGVYRVGAASFGNLRLRLPLQIVPGAKPLRSGGTAYAGSFSVTAAGNTLQLVDAVALETYVRGVVAAECPGDWPQAALQAQAVASRSYALANVKPRDAFDVYADDRSQNYRGLGRSYASADEATRATQHLVLRYAGSVIDAFFSASNGGLTTNADGVWGGATLPYLDVRPDPYDARSPVAKWGPVVISVEQIRKAFPAVPAPVSQVELTRNSGSRVTDVRFVGADGAATDVDGYTFQQRLRLRSLLIDLTSVTQPAR